MASEFGEVLADLVGGTPGALGAVFIDWEGESVDQFGHIPEFDIRIMGAHWGIILNQVKTITERHGLGLPTSIMLSNEQSDVIIRTITEDYYVVLALKKGAHLATALKELDRAVSAIETMM